MGNPHVGPSGREEHTVVVLIPSLVQLRSEFDDIAPRRSKASDGWIGDTAHQQSVSDHNDDETGNVPIHDADAVHEVHAIDVDSSGPWPDELTMEKVVQFLLARCRSGAEHRLRYVIYNRRIWSASSGWVQQAYAGASPHTEHAHFSASYDTAREASTASWHLEDLVMPTADEIATAVWTKRINSPALGIPDRAAADWLKDAEQVSRELDVLGKSLTAAIAALAAKEQVDETALAAELAPAVATLLTPVVAGTGGTVTGQELEDAVYGALRKLAA
jgi:hypothetical protein